VVIGLLESTAILMDVSHLDVVGKVFQWIAFRFAIGVHESAHAWMANRCPDPAARMLGRITVNPVKHIDPIGPLRMPLIAMVSPFPAIGWAKPTPVDPRKFKSPVADDILTSVARPVSNFGVASSAVIAMLIAKTSGEGGSLVRNMPAAYGQGIVGMGSSCFLVPVTRFILELFKLIPVPPLDGGHGLRHFLSDSVRKGYDPVGVFGLQALVYLGGTRLGRLISPPVNSFNLILTRF
jgi:Zn-dependent protease